MSLSLRAVPRQAALIFALVFIGSLCVSSLIPLMGYYIINGLKQPAWTVGIYVALAAPLTLIFTRWFGERLDKRAKVKKMLLASIISYMGFCVLLSTMPKFAVLVLVGAPLISLGNAGTSTTLTYARLYAEEAGLNIINTNSWMRMAMSAAWMIGPAVSFTLVDLFGFSSAFLLSGIIAIFWVVFWHLGVPNGFRGPYREPKPAAVTERFNWPFLLGAFICLTIAAGNSLFASVMPLYFVNELHLPGYTPGLTFTIKCLLEIFAIFAGVRLAAKVGSRGALMAAIILAIVSFVFYMQVTSVQSVIAAAVIEGIYFGIFAGVGINFLQAFDPDKPGRATAAYMNSMFIGGMIGGVSMGFIASAFDYRTVIYFAIAANVVGIFALLASYGVDHKQNAGLAHHHS